MTGIYQFSIADVARETGISRDTLRVWERRYGYPAPVRNERRERLYSSDQVSRLRLIKQLMDSGMQPGRLVAMDDRQLRQLTTAPHRSETTSVGGERNIEILTRETLYDLLPRLAEEQQRRGLRNFLIEFVAPLNRAVGDAWFAGRIGILDEHLYTEEIRRLLHTSLSCLPPIDRERPRALLTTLPGEPHGIGLQMVSCLLALEGVAVLSLGVQTPLEEIVRGAIDNRCSIVGISCSDYMGRRTIASQLVTLRALLPADISIWAGGSGVRSLVFPNRSIRIFTDLREISAAVEGEKYAASTGIGEGTLR